ncbi:hypothetical protein MPSEU_000500600 [Mayamaea pseudoterrestris]|nr:hypothetical protein MPSEU_000500600 [Mayamaea pseudoterrestris]
MSMAAALSNMASTNVFSDARRRMASSRVATTAEDDEEEEEANRIRVAEEIVTSDDEDDDDDDEEQQRRSPEDTADSLEPGADIRTTTRSNTVTLAELEEERELQRRRSSVCVMLSAFLLFRLWVLALEEGDFSLLLLCLVLTSWIARWIGMNREREEELDRRIANYMENPNGSDPELNLNDFRMLSFQAQLALAIMESQRQMMQGGYHPEGAQSNGVSDESRAKWERLEYKVEDLDGAHEELIKNKDGYGSVALKDKKEFDDDGPHCSICLGEYEDGDTLTKLPCQHLYHTDCITSWTESHITCPLCNFDLASHTVIDAAE